MKYVCSELPIHRTPIQSMESFHPQTMTGGQTNLLVKAYVFYSRASKFLLYNE